MAKGGQRNRPKALGLPDACNVVDCSTGRQQFWRFSKGKNQMKMVDVRDTVIDQPMQAKHLDRDASQMWRPHCQNDAWIPVQEVYFRVLHLPPCPENELSGMVELELDKISPLPLNQAVWTFELVPVYQPDRDKQTVVVMIARRAVVEQYVGELEKIGYRPDRLEPAVLHQLMATPEGGGRPDGAWIYPSFGNEKIVCTMAWWDEGVLHNITQITISSREHLNELTGHLTATTWAGEMEGWLTGDTQWHLVVDNQLGEEWLNVLNEWAGKGVQIEEPPEVNTMASVAAARAERPLNQGNLVPPDRQAMYHRDDVDRVWGNVLIWSTMFYVVLVSLYWVVKSQVAAKEEAAYQANRKALKIQKEYKTLGIKLRLLEEQRELRGTALNVLKAISEHIPAGVFLDSIDYTESRNTQGNIIVLRGRLDSDAAEGAVQDYSVALADEVTDKGRPLFSNVTPPDISERLGEQYWNIILQLKREGIEK